MNPIQLKNKIYYNVFFVGLVRLFNPLIMRVMKVKKVVIEGNIPLDIPLVIASHHEEKTDQYVIFSKVNKKLFWVADTRPYGKCLVDTRLIKWVMMKLGVVPIDRVETSRNVCLFDYLAYLFSKNMAVVIFPEGNIKKERDNNKFGEMKNGVIRIVQYAQKKINKTIPIYPLGIRYEDGIAYLKVGEPLLIDSNENPELVDWHLSMKSIEVLSNKIKELSGG